jgi:hypothetical protein
MEPQLELILPVPPVPPPVRLVISPITPQRSRLSKAEKAVIRLSRARQIGLPGVDFIDSYPDKIDPQVAQLRQVVNERKNGAGLTSHKRVNLLMWLMSNSPAAVEGAASASTPSPLPGSAG